LWLTRAAASEVKLSLAGFAPNLSPISILSAHVNTGPGAGQGGTRALPGYALMPVSEVFGPAWWSRKSTIAGPAATRVWATRCGRALVVLPHLVEKHTGRDAVSAAVSAQLIPRWNH
jgi:hypothetical protein